MKQSHRFNLEAALTAWRRSYRHRRALLNEDLDELEQHFRDEIAALVASGVPEEEAFRRTARQMGDQTDTEAAYRRVYWGKLKRKHERARFVVNEMHMLKNYLFTALRNLRKQAGYSIINVGGLAIGLASAYLIILFVQYERSYDTFHANAADTYRLIENNVGGQDAGVKSAIFAAGHASRLRQGYPEIESVVLWDDRTTYVKVNNESQRIGQFGFLSPEGLSVFTFPLLRGDKSTVFADRYSVLLTEETAARLFGQTDPIGQRISYNDQFDLTVTGILADLPSNSHLQFEALASIDLMRDLMGEDAMENFSNSNYWLYLKLVPGSDPVAVSDKLDDYLLGFMQGDSVRAAEIRLDLQPITDIHLTTDITWDSATNVDKRLIYSLSAIALLILLIAGINFANLATARAVKRSKEVGVRKAIGAVRGQLVVQFLGESALLSTAAVVLGVVMAIAFLPVFREIVGSEISISVINVPTLGLLLAVGLFAGLTAGVYPAIYLSSLIPARVLKGEMISGGKSALLRKALIVVQFGISVFLIVCTITVYDQIHYMRSANLGFDKEHVLFAPMSEPVRDGYETFRASVLQNPRILNVAQAGNVPGRVGTSRGYKWPGETNDEDAGRSFYTVLADYDYIETMGLTLVAGRNFSRDRPADFEDAYILNEQAVRALGFQTPEEAIGKPFRAWDRDSGEIIGVVRDFHYQSLHQQIEPVVLNIKSWISYVAFRVAPEDLQGSVAHLREQWQLASPGFPFEYQFLDDDLDRLYRAEEELGKLFTFFAVIAIFVACLGLFGLAAFSAQQRTKEIGIRKVLGASNRNITLLLSREFTVLVLLAFALSAPISYFVMHGWLSDFAYRAALSWWIFAGAGLIAVTIAWGTVGYQALRAAVADPVRSLRYE